MPDRKIAAEDIADRADTDAEREHRKGVATK